MTYLFPGLVVSRYELNHHPLLHYLHRSACMDWMSQLARVSKSVFWTQSCIIPWAVLFTSSFTDESSSGFSSAFSPACSFLDFSLSLLRAFSSILTCFPSVSCKRFAVLPSPSSLPIRDFISALSISQAFRSLSCRCHSVCRNRITPIKRRVSKSHRCSSRDL